MVAEEGVPGREGLGMGVGTLESVFLCPPFIWVCCVRCTCVYMHACVRVAYELQLQCEQHQCQFYL